MMNLLSVKSAFAKIEKIYEFKSAVYEIETSGTGMTGHAKGYVSDFGRQEWREEITEVTIFWDEPKRSAGNISR